MRCLSVSDKSFECVVICEMNSKMKWITIIIITFVSCNWISEHNQFYVPEWSSLQIHYDLFCIEENHSNFHGTEIENIFACIPLHISLVLNCPTVALNLECTPITKYVSKCPSHSKIYKWKEKMLLWDRLIMMVF